ncbi:NAD(P)/FAD-dependent oxidoreductase, partial [Pseudomonas viridiflava]
HLDRARFDAGLANAARSFGTQLVLGKRLKQVQKQDDGWRVDLSDDVQVQCRYLIDASGRSAWLGRAVGARTVQDDRLVGISAYFSSSDLPVESSSLVEAIPAGWWYSAPLPDGRMVAVLMTDADLLQAS